MSILIIGLGSMGRRRIRCLQALGYHDIHGEDIREDREHEAATKYGIYLETCHKPDAVFICLPPKFHAEYAARYRGIPTFIEAGIHVLPCGTPSATMMYHPMIKEIQEKLPGLGKLVNISYHCGQYLPDWHPYEKVSEFYAGEVGALEMVAFELTWIMQVFGEQICVKAIKGAEAAIDGLTAPDTVALILRGLGRECLFSIIIDVVSRAPIRQLVINGSEGQLRYDLNAGISEQMYIDETKAFLDGTLCNTLEQNNRIIGILGQTV